MNFSNQLRVFIKRMYITKSKSKSKEEYEECRFQRAIVWFKLDGSIIIIKMQGVCVCMWLCWVAACMWQVFSTSIFLQTDNKCTLHNANMHCIALHSNRSKPNQTKLYYIFKLHSTQQKEKKNIFFFFI